MFRIYSSCAFDWRWQCAFLFLYLVSAAAAYSDLPELKLGIFRKKNIFQVREFRKQPNNVLSDYIYNHEDYKIFQNYTIRTLGAGDSGELDNYSPTDILENICQVLIKKRANTMLFTQNKESDDAFVAEEYILRMAAYMGIPVLAYSGIIQPNPHSIILQLTPSIRHQCQSMLSLLERYKWYHFSILTGFLSGSNFFIDTLKKLVEESPIEQFNILSVVQVNSLKQSVVSKKLDTLSKSDTRVILFYASETEAEVIFDTACAPNKNLCDEEYVWIVSKSVIANQVDVRSTHWKSPLEYPPGLLALNYVMPEVELGTNAGVAVDRVEVNAITSAIKIWFLAMENLFNDMSNNTSLKGFTFMPEYTCDMDEDWNEHINMSKKWDSGHLLYQYMKKVVIPADEKEKREEFRFQPDGTLTDVRLEIYNLNMEREWREIGSWHTKEGLTINDVTWPNDNPIPPQGRPDRYELKVVTMQERPYVVYSDPDPKGKECPSQSIICRIAPLNETLNVPNATSNSSLYQCASGLSIDLLIRLSDSIRFKFDLFQVEDKKFGAMVEGPRQWNGIIRCIMDGRADMAMTSLTITPERNSAIDFSIPYLETGTTIIVGVRDGVISPTAFLEPFDLVCWLFILSICIIVVSVAMCLFECISPARPKSKNKNNTEPYDYPSWCLILVFSVHASGAAIFVFEWLSPSGLDRGNKPIREHRFSLFRSFWLIWAMLFGAAVNVDNPRGVSSRCLGNIWALFAVVFTASYTANLAAFMITKEDFDKLSGINDERLTHPQKHKPSFKFGTIESGSTEANIRKNYPEMYEWMRQYNKSDVAEGVKSVKDGDMNAFIYDATVLEYRASHDEGCKLRTVGNWYAMTGYGVGFPKGSKWITQVNKYLSKYQYEGVMERLQKFWLAGACKKGEDEREKSVPLGILNFTSAFILLAGGMILGGILLVLEHVYFKFFRAKLRKWDKCGCCGLVSLSMGKSLTFEQSVREAIELQKHFKCKNPICETQVWKLKHELDLALLKIDRLQRQSTQPSLPYDKRAVWKDPSRRRNPAQSAIGWKPEYYTRMSTESEVPSAESGQRREDKHGPDEANPHPVGLRNNPSSSSPYKGLYSTPGPSSNVPQSESAFIQGSPLLPPPTYNELSSSSKDPNEEEFDPRLTLSRTSPSLAELGVGDTGEMGVKASKSLPSSPMKLPVAGPSAMMPTTDLGNTCLSSDPNGPIKLPKHGHVAPDHTPGRRDKFKKGIRPGLPDGGTFEIETVL